MFNQIISNKGIGFRIMGGFTIVLIIGAISSMYGLTAINKVGVELKTIADEDIPMTGILTDITTKQLEQAILLERALRLGQIIADGTDIHKSLEHTEEEFIKLGHEVDEELKQFEHKSEEALQMSNDEAVHDKFQAIEDAAKLIEVEHGNYEKLAEQIFDYLNAGRIEKAKSVVGKTLEEEEKLDIEVKSLLHNLEKFTEAAAMEAEHHEEAAIATMTALTLGGVVVGMLLSFFISRGIVNPLKKVLDALEDIAEGEGDLTRRITVNGSDETAQVANAFNRFAEKIRGVMLQVMNSSGDINYGSQQISMGNLNLSQRTEEQASSLEETASSMEEMTSTVQQNAGNADHANQLAQSARNQAEEGGKVVAQAVNAMSEISQSSNKIAEIISVVEEIAFQTNLLALNAAVEAARAGEQGRGFAVVASEVRVLAGRSADAAKEIKGLIEDSVGKVKTGSDLVGKSGETLDEIVTGVKKVSDIVFEIAAASQEQSSGIGQVNTAVTQMDEMTQQNAALVEEAASASKAMEDQADKLMQLMGFFKLEEGVSSAKNVVREVLSEQSIESAHSGYLPSNTVDEGTLLTDNT